MLSKTKVFPLLKNTIFCKKNFPELLRGKPIDCVIARYCFVHCLRFLHMMNNELLPDNYLKIFLQQLNEIKRKI